MNHQKSELYFLLILLAGIFVLAFFIFKPFLYALALAMVFATVLHPEETECLYYLHDETRTIHCASTLAEHEENIEKYLH